MFSFQNGLWGSVFGLKPFVDPRSTGEDFVDSGFC